MIKRGSSLYYRKGQSMNYRFLDPRNCKALFPQVGGISLTRVLDDYLYKGINNIQGPGFGTIDRLIQLNKSSLEHLYKGPKRLIEIPFDIAINLDLTTNLVDFTASMVKTKSPCFLHINLVYQNGLKWKTIIPLQYLLKEWGDANDGYQGYCHSITQNISQINREDDSADLSYHYIGITGRNWLKRFKEHTRDMKKGKKTRFHAFYRDCLGMEDIHYASQLINVNLTYEEAMNWEETQVDKLGSNGLNMIPGGFKEQRLLHKYRIIEREDISLEERDKAIMIYAMKYPKKGIAHPFMSELWQDDEFYLKVIQAREKTLTPDQVRMVRELGKKEIPISQIVDEVDAWNELQVKNILAGRTYKRVK